MPPVTSTLARNAAFDYLARALRAPIGLAGITEEFGAGAQIVTEQLTDGKQFTRIGIRQSNGNIIDLNRAGTGLLDHCLPALAQAVTNAPAIIDPEIGSAIATLLTGDGLRYPKALKALQRVPTTLARSPQTYFSKYVEPTIRHFQEGRTAALQTALRELADGTVPVIAIFPEDQRKPNVFARNTHSDDAVNTLFHRNGSDAALIQLRVISGIDGAMYLVKHNTSAKDLFHAALRNGRGQVPFADARYVRYDNSTDRAGQHVAHDHLSSEESARVLSALDSSRNLEDWRSALLTKSLEQNTREQIPQRNAGQAFER